MRSTLLLRLLVCVLLSVAAACGGSDEPADAGVASVDDLATTTTTAAPAEGRDADTTTAAPSTTEATTTSEAMSPIEEQELALLDFSACMREEGIDDFPDVTVDNNGAIDVAGVLQSGVDVQSAEFNDAVDVCDDNVEDITFGAAAVPDPAEIIEQLFTFTECLRGEGVDAGDVTLAELLPRQANVPADVGSREEAIAYYFGVDPEDPAVLAAIDVCDEFLAGLPGA
jgi:hypothetical protein